ncbi:MAG: hypothetical protein ACPGTU_01885 [Myxococcota bacterium]
MSEPVELLTMSELFRGRFFSTATGHPGWRWQQSQVDDFLKDLKNLKKEETLHLGTVLHKPHPKKAIVFGGLKLTPHTLFDGYQRIATIRSLALATADALGEIDSPMAKMQANSLRRQFGVVDGHERLQDSNAVVPAISLPFLTTGQDAHDKLDAFINTLSRKVTVLFYETPSAKTATEFVRRQYERGLPNR